MMGDGVEGFDIPKGSVQDDPPQPYVKDPSVGAQRVPSIEEQLRSFPVPPRRVLIEAAGEIERLRRELVALRERHAAAVEKAAKELYHQGWNDALYPSAKYGPRVFDANAAWLASEARKGVTP